MLRIDDVEYQHVLGLRLNVWTSIVLFVLAAVVLRRRRPHAAPVARPMVYTEAAPRRRGRCHRRGLGAADADPDSDEAELEPVTTEPSDVSSEETRERSTDPPD